MNFSSSLSSFVCIVSAGVVCAAGAQTLSSSPADTPSFASSTLPGPVPPQRSAQAAVARAAAEPATPASATAASALTRPAASAAVQPDPRAHGTLRRPLVPARPHRAQVASTPADDVWGSGTLYASPYAKSPFDAPADPD
ncbi:hypothetical protein NTJ56_27995 [Burkholderia contaminans]|uniref:hypothetical protein n=1 Tax=Burkholderia contaminans TaxID=488447 RepID=UPI001CF53683|nr:hypothetical protein [Burkholderia contaminans]MCA7913637.1 hypothetical protein [Burkholderia contaminans]UUX39547.1 hypothetical protein NTJ56_27995 [Burkholderia contaminans]